MVGGGGVGWGGIVQLEVVFWQRQSRKIEIFGDQPEPAAFFPVRLWTRLGVPGLSSGTIEGWVFCDLPDKGIVFTQGYL